MNTPTELVPAATAAHQLGVTLAELYRLVDAGELHAHRDERGHLHVPAHEVTARIQHA